MVKKIAIVGAGVNGLSCAVKIAEYVKNNHNIEVNLLSEEFSPNTTGDGSAGLWSPYLIGDTAPDKIIKWSKETHEFFNELWNCGKAAEAGVCIQPATRFNTDLNPFWSSIVFGCTKLSNKQIDYYNKEHSKNYTGGVSFVTFTCEPIYLLPYLMQRFKSANGKVFQKRINSFDELIKEDYDLIINCAGLGAKTLTNDSKLKPIRGQVTRVKAPWHFQTFLDDDDDANYIISNMDTVILGGTHQENDFNQNVSIDDSRFIRNGCLKLVPSLKNAPVIKEWVGLRPGRESVRVEEETFLKNNGTTGKLIHNYGHGGSGVTISWGCATDVLNIVKTNIEIGVSNVRSKL